MSEIIVAKFGGSSLANSEQFKKVKNIVKENESRRYIIPSAPGRRHSKDYKITDLLYLCHAHVNQGIPFDDVFKLIENRYRELVQELDLSLDIDSYLSTIKKKIEGGVSVDYTASRGEYLNGIILANYLGYDFVDAEEVIFFKNFGSLDVEKTKKAISKKLSEHHYAVIPGFYGRDPNGKIKTFSRGGSDVTGSIIADGVNARLYENWTDVSGFLMADPRIVEKPKTIGEVTYRELRELSYMGASVLHEEAIFPLKDKGIPINIRNTNEPTHKGTFIVSDQTPQSYKGTITGIAGKRGFTVIGIEKTLMNSEQGFCRKLLSILEMHGVSFENMPSGIDSVSLVIADSELENKLDKILDEIERQCSPDSLEVHPNMSLIATVGRGMAQTKGISAKIFEALAKEKVNVRMINQGSSEINVIVGVEDDDFEKGVRAIYKAFNRI